MNLRKESSSTPLDSLSAKDPADRIAELERRLSAVEKEVAMLKQHSGSFLFGDETSPAEEKKRHGKERIADEILFHYRDGIVLWLEPVWPWMADLLTAPSTKEEEVRAIVEAVAEVPELRAEWQRRLLEHAAALFEFLWHERFRKTLPKQTVVDALSLEIEDERRWRAANQLPTRQIANAMAGVPEIVWRTSLDRCSAQPSCLPIALNLDMHYRDIFGIPSPKDRDLTGAFCPVPKPLQPVLARSNDEGKERSQPPIEA